MKRWFLLALLIVAVFVFIERDHLFVRDFLAKVSRNGAMEDGAQVYFNRHDDVLLENDNNPAYITLLQHPALIGVPNQINCIHFFICLVARDGQVIPGSGGGAEMGTMSKTGLQYRDDEGRQVVVTFR